MKKKVLVHVCGAHNAEDAFDRFEHEYLMGMYFYNPNIQPKEMYLKYADKIHKLTERKHITEFAAPYDPARLNEAIKSWEEDELLHNPCALCLYDRLQQTARIARINGYDCISTTLQPPEHLSAVYFEEILNAVAAEHGLKSVIMQSNTLIESSQNPCSACKFRQDHYSS